MYVFMYVALVTHQYVMQVGMEKASLARIVGAGKRVRQTTYKKRF